MANIATVQAYCRDLRLGRATPWRFHGRSHQLRFQALSDVQGASAHCAGTVARPNGQELAQELRAARVGQHCGKLALDAFELRCNPPLPQRGIAGALYRRVHGALAFAQPRHSEFDIAEQTPTTHYLVHMSVTCPACADSYCIQTSSGER